MTPWSASNRASAMIAAGGRLCSGPRTAGHDAVGAKLVAAHHDPDEGLKRAGPHRRLAVGIVVLKARGDDVERTIDSGRGSRRAGPAHDRVPLPSISGTFASWPGPTTMSTCGARRKIAS